MWGKWSGRGGYGEVVRVSLPLVISFGTTSLMHFTDRMFLSAYSLEAVGASLPAGILSFLLISFFMGVAGYVNVFVAQYAGAGRLARIGASLWQGVHFSLGSAAVLALFYFLAEPLFAHSGHPPGVRELETVYFQVLTLGGGLPVLSTALSTFFSGRGLTRPVMMVNLAGAAVNIPLDWALINGWGALPELGILGAGVATVVAQAVMVLMFAAWVFLPKGHRPFAVLSAWRVQPELFWRLMRFGVPGGVQMFLEIFAFTMFSFLVGRLGAIPLAATNIVVAINSLAFMPMVGLSVGVSTLVGQAIGRGLPAQGHQAAMNALRLGLGYMAAMLALYVGAPVWLMELFQPQGQAMAGFAPVAAVGVRLLKIVAVYVLFDATGIILAGALKGAGDVRFVMWAIAITSLGVLVGPAVVVVEVLDAGLMAAWLCAAAYMMVLSGVLAWRYRTGRWRGMRVIELAPSGPPAPGAGAALRTPPAAEADQSNSPA